MCLVGEQLQKDDRSWLSPPDLSKNHNIARTDHHDGTAAWFTQGRIFEEWKAIGSLMWIRGKRTYLILPFLHLLMAARWAII